MEKKSFLPRASVVLGTIFLLWFWLPAMVGIFHIGNVTGIICSALLVLGGLFWKQIKAFLSYAKEHLWAKILTRTVVVIAVIIGLIAVILTAGMIYSANQTPPENATVIVLGCKVNGTVPSRMLRGRLDKAVSYLNEHEDFPCIVTGGQGADEDIPEGEAMAKYLIEKGISPDRIYIESLSTSTEENIKFSKDIIDKENLYTEAVIISDGFHVFRGTIIAEKQGLEACGAGAFTDIFLFPCYYVRELFALMNEILLK